MKKGSLSDNEKEPGGLERIAFRFAILAISLVMVAIAAAGIWHMVLQPEYPEAMDRCGYLEMARDIRTGAAPNGLPKFTYDGAMSREMLAFLRGRGVAVDYAGAASPGPYHYLAGPDVFVCQYPPGVG